MNPILSRYVGFALVALIAGVGGGMLAVKEKTANSSANPPSGTVVAIPAQPFPGQGVPAVRAIPAVPVNQEKESKVSPAIKDAIPTGGGAYAPQIPQRGYLFANQPAIVTGSNFANKNNDILWDGKAIATHVSAYDTGDNGMGLYFTVPSDAPVGSVHTISVKTPLGTSNTISTKIVEYLRNRPSFIGISPYIGSTGTKVAVDITGPDSPYPSVSANFYLSVMVPASTIKTGAVGWVHTFVPGALETSMLSPNGGISYFTIPKEVIYCPSSLSITAEWAAQGLCPLASPDTRVKLGVGSYHAYVFYEFKFANSTFSGMTTPYSAIFSDGPWNTWYDVLTISN